MHFKVLHENLEFPEGRSIDRDAKGLIREVGVICQFALRPNHSHQNDSSFRKVLP